jgi:hypothetical protein
MERLQFSIKINASPDKVYEIMLGLKDKSHYEKWTAAFNPTSSYEGTWGKGTKIFFIGIDEDGHKGGMVAMVEEHVPANFVSLKHIGILAGDVEIY